MFDETWVKSLVYYFRWLLFQVITSCKEIYFKYFFVNLGTVNYAFVCEHLVVIWILHCSPHHSLDGKIPFQKLKILHFFQKPRMIICTGYWKALLRLSNFMTLMLLNSELDSAVALILEIKTVSFINKFFYNCFTDTLVIWRISTPWW